MLLTAAVMAVGLLAGCASCLFTVPTTNEQEALALFETGKGFYDRGDYEEAIATFTTIIESYPRSRLVDDAYYMASLSFAKRGDWEHAVGAGQQLQKNYPRSPMVGKVQIILGEGYENMGMSQDALTAYVETVVISDNPTERDIARTRARNLLGREKDFSFLVGLYEEYRYTEAAEWLLYYLGTLAYEEQRFAESEQYYDILRREFPRSPYIDLIGGRDISAAAFSGELVIGALLPLSGSFSAYGNQVKEGLELAYSVSNAPKVTLKLFDTGSDPAQASRGAENLIRQGAHVLVGPLTSAEVGAVSGIVKQSGVVMISPTSTDPSLLSTYNCLFQLNSYAEMETKAIARYALERGLTKFGILYPETEQGRLLADAFASTVRSGGGTVLYSQPLAEKVVEMKSTFTSVRHMGAQALFLPFDRHQLLSVVPQVAYYRLRVQILGIDDFADAEILRRGGTVFQGAWFAAPPFRLSDPIMFEAFYSQYHNRYGHDPEWAAALGYDTYNFLYRSLQEGKHTSICEALRSLDNRRGVMGRLMFTDTPSQSSVRIYTIDDDEVKEL